MLPEHFGHTQGIDFINFLDQPGPTSPAGPVGQFRLKNARNFILFTSFLAFAARDTAVMAIVAGHLLALVGNMRTHGSQPFQGFECFDLLPVFGPVLDLALLPVARHSFLGERSTNNVAGQVFH